MVNLARVNGLEFVIPHNKLTRYSIIHICYLWQKMHVIILFPILVFQMHLH